MKIFILIFSLVQHWNRSIININEFHQLVLGQFPLFWPRYVRIVIWPSTYLFIYFQQVILSLSIFCCKYFLAVVVRNRFYLLIYTFYKYFIYIYINRFYLLLLFNKHVGVYVCIKKAQGSWPTITLLKFCFQRYNRVHCSLGDVLLSTQ